MKVENILIILLFISILSLSLYGYYINKENYNVEDSNLEDNIKEYSGAVRPCDDEEYFRKTGITRIKENCKWLDK